MGEFVRDPLQLKRPFMEQSLERRAVRYFVEAQGTVAFHAGKVVQTLPDIPALAMTQANPMGVADHKVMEITGTDLQPFLLHRPVFHGMVGEGKAMGLEWAAETVGVLGHTVQGAELHHGLVVPTGVGAVEQLRWS